VVSGEKRENRFASSHFSLLCAHFSDVMDACASGDDLGQQVGKAAQRLVKAGFEKTYMLNGGNIGWHAAQLPVAKGSK
jgi:hypothetical protein